MVAQECLTPLTDSVSAVEFHCLFFVFHSIADCASRLLFFVQLRQPVSTKNKTLHL